jgi:2-polyprenyl-3-methyl-5-hydroxy-6-metoxy-1,4-benzoquinol methylase
MGHWSPAKPDLNRLHHLIAGSVEWKNAERDALLHADLILPPSWVIDPHPQGPHIDEHNCPMLEVGCGIGRLLRVFASRGFTVSGTDISRPMLEEAKKYLAGYTSADREPGKGFVKALYLDKPETPLHALRDETYGFVYSMLVFQHLPSLTLVRDVVKGIFRVLRPGGVVRVQTHVGHPKTDTDAYHPWIGSLFPNSSAFADVFSQAGFNILQATQGEGYKEWLWVTARKPKA